ncbi:MAG: glutamine synthetase type III, partial [Clostridia bacterium]|nr:glutamine synthetase type III [Clostridia bacterium]
EAAPAQHELAPIFTPVNISTDHNQLTMEIMQKVARKHGLVCLLHEKPFAGVAGSGKHNNWSLSTNTGINLLTPGETPAENAQFLLFLCAVIQAVDDYQDLLRISVATAGNDHRLGALEAPPAVVSIFLGDELSAILDALESGTHYDPLEKTQLKLGVHTLPKLPKDATDRNRTSPFAFTGNKFEFRMLGSSNSISDTNVVLNTAVAESLRQYADKLEAETDFDAALNALIRDTIRKHKRIIFNGNGYDDAWIREATEERGLLNLRSTPDCMPYMLSVKNLKLFADHKVFTEAEVESRYDITLENYCKTIHIEAATMIDMVRKEVLPAVSSYTGKVCSSGLAKKSFCGAMDTSYEEKLAARLAELTRLADREAADLAEAVEKTEAIRDLTDKAFGFKEQVCTRMEALRSFCDEAESLTEGTCWPFPTYADLLFGVR